MLGTGNAALYFLECDINIFTYVKLNSYIRVAFLRVEVTSLTPCTPKTASSSGSVISVSTTSGAGTFPINRNINHRKINIRQLA